MKILKRLLTKVASPFLFSICNLVGKIIYVIVISSQGNQYTLGPSLRALANIVAGDDCQTNVYLYDIFINLKQSLLEGPQLSRVSSKNL